MSLLVKLDIYVTKFKGLETNDVTFFHCCELIENSKFINLFQPIVYPNRPNTRSQWGVGHITDFKLLTAKLTSMECCNSGRR